MPTWEFYRNKPGRWEEILNKLAEFKVNQFQLYTEHTFAYRSHENR